MNSGRIHQAGGKELEIRQESAHQLLSYSCEEPWAIIGILGLGVGGCWLLKELPMKQKKVRGKAHLRPVTHNVFLISS